MKLTSSEEDVYSEYIESVGIIWISSRIETIYPSCPTLEGGAALKSSQLRSDWWHRGCCTPL